MNPIDPITHDVENSNLQILEWPSGALEFRRTELRSVGNSSAGNKFQCFVVSGADREKFLAKLDEIRKIDG